jgi:hypothetical protein
VMTAELVLANTAAAVAVAQSSPEFAAGRFDHLGKLVP